MNTELTSINRSENLLYPPFKRLLEIGLEKARSLNLQVYLFEGFRTPQRQNYLYMQGRANSNKVVTNAKPGQSWHNYGLAADLVFDGDPRPGIQWAWDGDYIDSKAQDYEILGQVMMSVGLEWLGKISWDKPHFQFTMGLSIYKALLTMNTSGILGVWHLMDQLLEKGKKP